MEKQIEEKIKLLEDKYAQMGQDLNSYLDGLLLSNYLTYWDYTQVDTLLTLQNPKTDFPDEMIFIIYHQITELYFKLSLHELEQIANNGRDILPNGKDNGWKNKIDPDFFAERVTRVNRYFEALTKSFEIMVDGMEKEQFLRYRMALLPASGFQSAQYRLIEMSSTDFINLVDKEVRHQYEGKDASIEDMFNYIYWNKGATELATGKKTLTLNQFEKKYSQKFIDHATNYKYKNIWQKYLGLSPEEQQNPKLVNALKQLDVNVNINWPLMHYKSAVRYLQQNTGDIAATGGTNWQKYLPPRFQKRIFYPQLWTEEEKEDWGKGWVETNVFKV
ncbi:MAG: Tryptophan 2,3-dioxygenase apoenzyme [Bacteroidetes bacterium]|jgi:tryptophan 2,3-dioxygenase|nr:Tryptophan 2,3-dioxygenase apoenzyme [Bacteroidota bacterium]